MQLIQKVRNPTELGHYRLISILPALLKAIERLVLQRIRDHLEAGDLLDSNQWVYRAEHSTQTCLVWFLDMVRKAIDAKQVTLSVFIDFSKVFDRVDHAILLRKLRELKFSDSTFEWILSYLSNGKWLEILLMGHSLRRLG